MDASIEDVGEDFATVILVPNRDDCVSLGGYPGEMRLRFSLYSHEARQLIELLAPIAERGEESA